MNEQVRKERGLKVDNGFKITLLCLGSDDTSPEQKLGIARGIKTSLERAKKIIAKGRNPRLFLNISKEEQAFVNQFLPDDEQIIMV
jgi:hypothetical protein